MMGSEEFDSEKPLHKVAIAKPFAVGRFETTFAEWDACKNDGGCQSFPNDRGWGRGTRPVINVSWDQITNEYLPWLRVKTGKAYRLMTEAEWEYASRAGSRTKYPWGDDIGSNRANCDGCGSEWDNRRTAPVGSFQPNAFGLYDMHGNVWEQVADCYKDNYVGAPSDGSAVSTSPCARGVRGGSWNYRPTNIRSANRERNLPALGIDAKGFRVARTLD
jgi:formylglycine-generating enzyme required for sulfatase activity